MRPSPASAAATRRRPALLIVALTVSALFATAVGLWAWRSPRVGAGPATPTETPLHVASVDQASTAWRLAVPVPDPAPTPVAVPAVEPTTDWAALAIGIVPATAASAAPTALAAATPADLEIAMSARERRALIASAREPVGEPAPEGYRPGIAVIVPGGSQTDGVCR